jgi:hypothetical protein
MKIEEFLTKHIDGYLLHDLKNMADIGMETPEEPGLVNYPMVATVLSGMELLGGILSIQPFNPDMGDRYFSEYWKDYLVRCCPERPEYNIENLDRLFRNLVRHGVVHTFLAKQGVWIVKGHLDHHLNIDRKNKRITIDSIELYKDFEKSYMNLVRPIVFELAPPDSKTTRENMQQRLDEMVRIYSKHSRNSFDNLGPCIANSSFSNLPLGATGSACP